MRVYLPGTTTVLRALVDEGTLPGPHTAFAVTPELRQFYELSDARTDEEELEYAALLGAARASLRLIDVDPTASRRRVVVAADGSMSISRRLARAAASRAAYSSSSTSASASLSS